MSTVITHETSADACWWTHEGDLVTARLGCTIEASADADGRLWLRRLRPLASAAYDATDPHRLLAMRAAVCRHGRQYGDDPALAHVCRHLGDGLASDSLAISIASDLLTRAWLSPRDLLSLLDYYLSVLAALETAP